MKLNYLSGALLLLVSSASAQLLDESQGFECTVANMGYPQEIIPCTKPVMNYTEYEGYAEIGKDILLIIAYNQSIYEDNEFLTTLYKPFFPHIVFYGPRYYPQVHNHDAFNGIYGYMAIALAMERYPDYKGYLFVSQDCLANPWNFVRFDKNKIWTGDKNHRRIFAFGEKAQWSNWNHDTWGASSAQKAYLLLNKRYLSMLKKNCGEGKVMGGMSDMVYFPAQHRNDVIELCKLFHSQGIFIEIALPTIIACLNTQKNWEELHGRGCYLNKYNPYLDFVSPTDFSIKDNHLFIQEQFTNVMSHINKLECGVLHKLRNSIYQLLAMARIRER
jgi:hypothetical protein